MSVGCSTRQLLHARLLDCMPSCKPQAEGRAVCRRRPMPPTLCRYAASESGVVQQLLERHAFEKFVESITKVAELHGDIAAVSLVEMYVALMRFTDNVHPDKLQNVNRVLGACQRGLAGK